MEKKRTADEQSFSFWKLTKYFYCIADFFIGEIEFFTEFSEVSL